jgi:hypothetical protein
MVLTRLQHRSHPLHSLRSVILLLTTVLLLLITGQAHSELVTRVPISAESGTSIAGSLFPLTITLDHGKLFLTDPTLLFLDDERLGMELRFQAYDHRPQDGIAISETGRTRVSGKLDYDPATRQVLLHAATLDKLEFDRDNEASGKFSSQVRASWSSQVTDPIRSELPAHPYILPIKDNIEDISYDGQNIYISLIYM